MKIEHSALYVADLKSAKEFFERYFGAKSNDGYYNMITDFKSYFLEFDDGARLEIMSKPEVADLLNKMDTNMLMLGYHHIAFSTGSKEKVDELTKKLRQDGYEVISGPRTTGDGYYESCIVGVEGNRIEITA